MNRIRASFLLFSLLVPFLATCIWYTYHQYQIRKNIKHQLIENIGIDRLSRVTVAVKDTLTVLDWEHSKEFEYEGEMYDVVSREFVGDSVTYYCWWDYKETDLNKQLSGLISQAWGNDDKPKHHNAQLVKFYKSLYCDYPDSWVLPYPNSTILNFKEAVNHITIVYLSLNSPPPELAA